MKDLISRQAAIDAILEMNTENRVSWLDCVLDTLDVLPSAEPESCEYWDAESNYCALNRPSAQPERKKAQWKEDPSGYGFWVCSNCGFVSEASGANILYSFCPHCGVEMKGEDDE